MSCETDMAVKVNHVGKTYQLYHTPKDRIKQMLLPRLQRRLGREARQYYTQHHALRDVSFSLQKGETLGVIGRNGAGKSTLLQIISGTLQPTSGEVIVNGRIAALLELGAGFNAEFSGRENIFLYGAILGLEGNEIEARYDEIVEFAAIGDFIEQPVKTYSSGMFVRLAFAVAACLEPDILIVDEALAVGDVKFQAKCFRRFEELISRGVTILFVTHSTEQIVRHCDRAILLHDGTVVHDGDPREVSNRYMDLMFGVEAPDLAHDTETTNGIEASNSPEAVLLGRFEERPGYNPSEYRWGDRLASIRDFHISQDGSAHTVLLESGKPVIVRAKVDFSKTVEDPIFGLAIKTPDGVMVYASNSRDQKSGPLKRLVKAGESLIIKYTFDNRLVAGDYLLSLGVARDEGGQIVPMDRRFDSIHVEVSNPDRMGGLADFELRVCLEC